MVIFTRGNVCSSVGSLDMNFSSLYSPPLCSDHRVKEKDREKKKDRNKEWKNHRLPPVHDIARENGEAISPQKGRHESDHLSWKVFSTNHHCEITLN